MHKLVILIEELEDPAQFEAGWPEFLRSAEQMPGLLRESTSRISQNLYGRAAIYMIHELYFDSPQAAYEAMNSSAGQSAGRTLQAITRGQVSLFFADHREDTLNNIHKARTPPTNTEDRPDA